MAGQELTARAPGAPGAPGPGAAAGEADRRTWLMLGVLLLGQFMGLLDVTIVNVATPTIGADLHSSGASLQMVVGGYTVAYAMLLITGARLGDLYGRRRMYLAGAAVFTATSLLCGLAPDTAVLVGARLVQGAGAAVMVPQIMSVIQMRFTGPARAKALSAYGAVLSVGAVAGLVVGGVLVDADLFGAAWRPVFLVNVPLGLLLLALVPRLVPADEPRGARRLDVPGLILAVPAVILVVLPLVLGHETGWPAWGYACMAAGVALAAAFVALERRVAARGGDPLLRLDVLRAPGMSAGLATLSCMQVGYGGFLFTFALHLQLGLGDTALRAGLAFVPLAAVFGAAGFWWRRLPAPLQPFLPLAGLTLGALGYLGIASALHDGSQTGPLLWASMVVCGAGMGLSLSPLLALALVSVPSTQAPDASGLLTTTMQLGQVIGVAAFGTLYLTLTDSAPSGHAIATTARWMAALSAVGVAGAVSLTRAVRSPSPAVRR